MWEIGNITETEPDFREKKDDPYEKLLSHHAWQKEQICH